MMAATISASAQVYLGGAVGFESTKANENSSSLTTFKIMPEVGYNLDDNWAVGIQLGYGSNQTLGKETPGKVTTTTFTIAPYARYTFAKSGIASFFVDGGIQYTAYGSDTKGSTFGVGFRPGVKIAASNKVDLVARFGYLGYKSADKDAQALGYGHEKDRFGFDINGTTLQFGVLFNL